MLFISIHAWFLHCNIFVDCELFPLVLFADTDFEGELVVLYDV